MFPALFVAVLALVSCTSKPPRPFDAKMTKAQWETKLRVKDLAKDKTQSLSVDVLGERGSNLRLEASAILGYPVASYVMNREGFQCAVYSKKVFYEGGLSETALEPLLRLPLSPTVLSRVAFDEPIRDRGWSCANGQDGLVASCESASRGLKVVWNRKDEAKTVRIEGATFQMDWVFNEPRTEVQFKDDTFRLKVPKDFRVIRL